MRTVPWMTGPRTEGLFPRSTTLARSRSTWRPIRPPHGHEPAKVDVGGIAVTKEEIHAAIAHLNEDKSTAVKQPLKKKGHPLARSWTTTGWRLPS